MLTAAELNDVTVQFIRFMPMPIFFLGLIGNIFNMIIFTRHSLISNPCTIYLLSGTFSNVSVLFFGLVIRSMMDGFHINLIGNNLALCRIRYIILHPSLALSSWFVVLASVDRFCITSQNTKIRKFNNLSTARRSVILATCICLIVYSHVLGLFEIEQRKSGPYCYAQVGTYRIFYDFLFFATFSFLPPILMMIIGLATLHNMRQIRARSASTTSFGSTTTTLNQLHKKDRNLLAMLFVQLIATIVCTLPHAIQKLYATFTNDFDKSTYRSAVENLISQITRQLLYVDCSISFYMYNTISTSVFRQEFVHLINKTIIFVFGNNSRIIHRPTQRIIKPIKEQISRKPSNGRSQMMPGHPLSAIG